MGDWYMCDYTAYIQGKYFRTGVYTHLDIELGEDERTGELAVSWTFTFQDLGSTHVIARAPVLVVFDDGQFFVGGNLQRDIEQTERALFTGYADFLRSLYEEEGIHPVQ
jgi:hypothetical protein